MKLILIFILLSLLNASGNSFSQNVILNLSAEEMTVKEAIRSIEKQSQYRFLYNDDFEGLHRLVSFNEKERNLNDLLGEILTGSNLTYRKLENDLVVLTPVGFTVQDHVVTGQVTDASTATALPGVTVMISGTQIGTVTNAFGYYEINIPRDVRDPSLTFSFVGMITREVAINDQTTINVQLEHDLVGLDEVVVIGYGAVTKRDLTGSVTSVDATMYENQASTNLLEFLAGTVAGLSIDQGTTARGGGDMLIRGTTSLKANNDPLIVLDGVIYNGDITEINPSDIQSIEVLKDASSAAVFGARSASGVIIVTTKRGTEGAPRINFQTKVGRVGLTNIMWPAGPGEYEIAKNDTYRQFDLLNGPQWYYWDPRDLPPDITVEEWLNYDPTPMDDPVRQWLSRMSFTTTEVENYLAGRHIDWMDLGLQNGIRQDYDLSISGGTPDVRYYWSAGYTDNNGYIRGDQFTTIRSRVNLEADVRDFVNLRVNAQYAHNDASAVPVGLFGLYAGSPYGAKYEADGVTLTEFTNEAHSNTGNPFINYYHRDQFAKTQSLFANVTGQIKLPYNISFQTSFINRASWNNWFYFDNKDTRQGFILQGYGERHNSNVHEWQIDNLLTWNQTFGDMHRLDATFLFNVEKYQDWSNYMTNQTFSPTDALSYHALGAGISSTISSSDEYSTGDALMGRINYTLLDRYILTLSVRRDGYSAFGQDNPRATFPSAALAWIISDEGFFNVGPVDYLKIRGSWGFNGNREIGRYEALARLSTVHYIYGFREATGVYSSRMANSGLRWEKTEAINLGLDFGILRNRFSGNIDVYKMNTIDLLMDRRLPVITGYSNVAANLGEVENRGLEMTLNSQNINIPNLRWNSSLVFSLNRNKILHLYGDMIDVLDDEGNVIGQREADDIANGWYIDQSLFRIYGLERIGVWQMDELEEARDVWNTRPGNYKYRDVNGDGIFTREDYVWQGYTTPQYRLGLRNDISFLRNFQLSFFLRADLNFYRSNPGFTSNVDRRNVFYTEDRWTERNPHPENGWTGPTGWRNSSFLRLQDLTLTYNVPGNMINRIESLSVFINLRNYVTITPWAHWDPETGTTPMPKFFTAGINLNL